MADRSFRSTTRRPDFGVWRIARGFPGTRATALAALAAAISAISAVPAIAQEWRVTPGPHILSSGVSVCSLYSPRRDRYVGFSVDGHSSHLIIRASSLVGIADGSDVVIRYPSGNSRRATLLKEATDADTAMIDIPSVADLNAMIDQFATPGDFSVAVLGGSPTAFRISQLPGASNEIATLRACMEELDLG